MALYRDRKHKANYQLHNENGQTFGLSTNRFLFFICFKFNPVKSQAKWKDVKQHKEVFMLLNILRQ
jgi:hypothetical protein